MNVNPDEEPFDIETGEEFEESLGIDEDTTFDLLDGYEATQVGVRINGTKLSPLVYETETSGTAAIATYSDQCGYSESEQTSSGTSQHTINAFLTQEKVERLWFLFGRGDIVQVDMPTLDIISEVDQIITDMTIRQSADVVTFVNDNGIERAIFDVQIQLKSPEAVNSGEGSA